MSIQAHRLERVGTIKPKWGTVSHVIAAPDCRSYALITEPADDLRRVVFGGRVVAETGPNDPLPMSLSFDGSRLAVAVRLVDDGGRFTHRIEVNGKPAYAADLNVVHHLNWLSNDRLAWNGWNEDKDGRIDDGGIRRFVNGVDVTGSLDFEPMFMDRMRHVIRVKEGDASYMIYDDGSRSAVPIEWDREASRAAFFASLEAGAPPRPERPDEVWDDGHRSVRVHYHGLTGPAFDGIESFGGMRSYAMNADGRRAAYVGIRYTGAARAIGRSVGTALGRLDGGPRGLSKLWAWPLALLFNPYMGIGHAYIEGSRRYFPVDHEREWKKGWRFASDHFYTPHDKLVVTCADGDGVRVVIDETEGPVFDTVENVRYLGGEDAVCYLVRRDLDLVRVTVE